MGLRYFGLWLMLCLGQLLRAQVLLEDMRHVVHPDRVQIVLELNGDAPVNHFLLDSPPRIVLDLESVAVRPGTGLNVHQGAVHLVRTGRQAGRTLRVVVDLKEKVGYRVLKQQDGRSGVRLLVDVLHPQFSGQGSAPVNATPSPKFVSHPPPPPPEALPATRFAVAPQTPPLATSKKHIIVTIDPGHGGKDPGAISPFNGLREKDVTLSIAKRLQKQLRSRGIQALLTRDSDVFLPLRKRIEIARQQKADLFISIHADSVQNSQPRGSSVYILSTKGASSQLARYLANSENEADLKWGVDVSRYDDDLQQMLLNIQQEGTLESSQLLAEYTLNELAQVGRIHKKQVERANFVVLRAPDIPSMLVETAFISNPEEARLLATAAYQEKIALGIARGVERFQQSHLPQHMLLQQ